MNPIKETKVYDGKMIWEEYMSLGRASSYRVVADWCEKIGMVNPMTGRASMMGVNFAMWRYAARNPEEAYETYKPFAIEFGKFLTFREFCQLVYDHSLSRKGIVVGKKEKKRFYEKYLKDTVEHAQIAEPA